MGVEAAIQDIAATTGELDMALRRVAAVWDDQVAENIGAQCVNDVTDCARDGIEELTQLSARIRWIMDLIVGLTY